MLESGRLESEMLGLEMLLMVLEVTVSVFTRMMMMMMMMMMVVFSKCSETWTKMFRRRLSRCIGPLEEI